MCIRDRRQPLPNADCRGLRVKHSLNNNLIQPFRGREERFRRRARYGRPGQKAGQREHAKQSDRHQCAAKQQRAALFIKAPQIKDPTFASSTSTRCMTPLISMPPIRPSTSSTNKIDTQMQIIFAGKICASLWPVTKLISAPACV